ncbi:hypothetical protein D3C87_2018330 [compost metagenome]
MMRSASAIRSGSPQISRARDNAMCSQVQASSFWYFSKVRSRVATGPLLPEGRSRMSTSYSTPSDVGADSAAISRWVRRVK